MVTMCYCFLTSQTFLNIANYNWLKLRYCAENKVLFACSGIPVQLGGPVSGFLTSASLVKAFNDKRTNHGNLKVGAADRPLVIFLFYIR